MSANTQEVTCTTRFEANSDVSGVGVVAAVYLQAFLIMLFYAAYCLSAIMSTSRTGAGHRWFGSALKKMIDIYMVVGMMLSIAAWTTWERISMYHKTQIVFLVHATLAGAGLYAQFKLERLIINYSRPLLGWHIVVLGLAWFSFLFLGGSVLLKANDFSNEPGLCFSISPTRLKVLLIAMLVFHLVQAALVGIVSSVCGPKTTSKGYFALLSFGVWGLNVGLLITSFTFTVINGIENKFLMDGSEFEWGFGQVFAFGVIITTLQSFFRDCLDYRKEKKHGLPPPK